MSIRLIQQTKYILLICIFILLASSPAALAEPQVSLSCDIEDSTVPIGTTLHFTLSGTDVQAMKLMIVTPDSRQEFMTGEQCAYTLAQPGLYVFVGYGLANEAEINRDNALCMSGMVYVTAKGEKILQEEEISRKQNKIESNSAIPIPSPIGPQYMNESTDESTLWRAKKMLQYAQDAYSTHGFHTGYVKPNQFGNIYYRANGEGSFPDTIFRFQKDEQGNPILTIAFEGTQTEQDLEDIWTDANAIADQNGIHSGFDKSALLFIDRYIDKREALNNDGIVRYKYIQRDGIEKIVENYQYVSPWDPSITLADMIEIVNNDPQGKIEVAGHSLGGALAQVLTYYFIKDYGVDPKKIETYTFASPVPFLRGLLSDEIWKTVQVYNIINKEDFVPDVGVCSEMGLEGINRYGFEFSEAVASLIINPLYSGVADGGHTLAGMNLGTNIYLDANGEFVPELVDIEIIPLFNDVPILPVIHNINPFANHDAGNYNKLLSEYEQGNSILWYKNGEPALFYDCSLDNNDLSVTDAYISSHLSEFIEAYRRYCQLFDPVSDEYGLAVQINSKWYAYENAPYQNYFELSKTWEQLKKSIVEKESFTQITDIALFHKKSYIGWNGGSSIAGDMFLYNGRLPVTHPVGIETIRKIMSNREERILEFIDLTYTDWATQKADGL